MPGTDGQDMHLSLPLPGPGTASLDAGRAGVVDVAALFDAHARAVARCAERILGPGAHVEDVVQEVFLVAHRRRDVLAGVENRRAWLLGVCVRSAQHHVRGKMRRRSLVERIFTRDVAAVPAPPDGGLEREDARSVVRAGLATLDDDERAVFLLYEIEELTGKDIAAALALPEKTVWSRLARARQKFAHAAGGHR